MNCTKFWYNLGTTLFFDFFSRYLNLHKITFVDNSDVTNRANFHPVVTSTFCKKKAKNDCEILNIFCGFGLFDLQNDLLIQI